MKLKCPIGVPNPLSMRQKHRKIKQKCLIEQLYGTNQTENEAKLSHRSDQIALFWTL